MSNSRRTEYRVADEDGIDTGDIFKSRGTAQVTLDQLTSIEPSFAWRIESRIVTVGEWE